MHGEYEKGFLHDGSKEGETDCFSAEMYEIRDICFWWFWWL